MTVDEMTRWMTLCLSPGGDSSFRHIVDTPAGNASAIHRSGFRWLGDSGGFSRTRNSGSALVVVVVVVVVLAAMTSYRQETTAQDIEATGSFLPYRIKEN